MGRKIIQVRTIGHMLPYTKTIGQFTREQTGARLARTTTVKRKIDWKKFSKLEKIEQRVMELLFPRNLIKENAERRKLGKPAPLQVYPHGNRTTEVARILGITPKKVGEIEESAFNKMEVKNGETK